MSKNTRKIKVVRSSGYKYKPTPTIHLKGNYLEAFGFSIDTPLIVHLSDGKIIIEKEIQ